MISNEQMEKLWNQYKNEGLTKNLSIQDFCSIHNVPYNEFENYLKLRRHFSDVHHMTDTDLPDLEKIKETLFRALDKLDELYEDCNCYERQLRNEREAHDLEVSRLKAEIV